MASYTSVRHTLSSNTKMKQFQPTTTVVKKCFPKTDIFQPSFSSNGQEKNKLRCCKKNEEMMA
jgi:hypothetical protein